MTNIPWVSEKEASKSLGVDESTLRFWRKVGYLRPGTHWRRSPEENQLHWEPKVIYHLRWCKEVIEYWEKHDAPISKIVA